MRGWRYGILAVAMVAAAAAATVRPAAAQCSAPYLIEQKFPTTGAEQTRWKVCWQVQNGPNLVITGAWFRPAPMAAWIRLVYDARVSQLFVPYHAGSPRYLDVNYGFPPVPLTTGDCPAGGGTILGASKELCKQVRDRGLAWKHDASLRRGEELVLWSVLAAANYNYVVEWTFRDDGVLMGRVGATGQIAGTDSHMHGPIWRLDLDLNGACCDTVAKFRHQEPGASASDTMTDIPTETGFGWDPLAFTSLELRDGTLKNSLGHSSQWHLMAARDGTPVHSDAFTKNAFWVTRYRWNEMAGNDLPTYVANAEPVANSDVVLWYYAGLHHHVRDEDVNMTHMMWLGFMLKPFDVWSTTPLYP
jgi:copper amine oxidase-like protein